MPEFHRNLLAYIELVNHDISSVDHIFLHIKKITMEENREDSCTLSLVHICPSFGSAQDVVDFLALHFLALEISLIDQELVRTSPALQPVLSRGVFIGRRAARNS